MTGACHCVMLSQLEQLNQLTNLKTGVLAKYAFLYMVQPLPKGVPEICLACLGSDNKFNGEVVLKRWKLIQMK